MKLFLLTLFSLAMFSCSVPVIESTECRVAREELRKLYAGYIGSRRESVSEKLKEIESGLTPDAKKRAKETDANYFTRTEIFPTAFRIGSCVKKEEKLEIAVKVFVKTESRPLENDIFVTMARNADEWQIDSVSDTAEKSTK